MANVGAGRHQMLSKEPYTFSRQLIDRDNQVVVGLGLPSGEKNIVVKGIFNNGQGVVDAYSGMDAQVEDGLVKIDSPYDIVLLEEK